MGVLNALIASNRNSTYLCSVIGKLFERLISICLSPGPRSLEIGQFPSLPGAGIAIVSGSNHTYPPPAKFLYGVARDGSRQSGRGWKYAPVGSLPNWIMEMGSPPCAVTIVS